MEWNIQFADDASRMTVRAWGMAEVPGFIAYLLAAVDHPAWRPGIPALMDFRDLDVGRLSGTDIQRLADLHAPYAEMLAQGRIAVLVARPVEFGMVRMWQAFVHHMHLAHGVFYSLEEAEAWLEGR